MVETGPDRENPSPAVEYAVKLARFDTEVYARDMGRARSEEAQRHFFEARLRYHLFDNGLQLLVQRLGLRRRPKAHAYELAQALCSAVFREGGAVDEEELVMATAKAVRRGTDRELGETVLVFTCEETLAGFSSEDAARLKKRLASVLAHTPKDSCNWRE